MPEETTDSTKTPPASLADVHLPPTFVSDHCIRTLSNQGPLTPAEIAKHWRVPDAVVIDVVESLKSAGYLQADTAQASFERGRLRLSEAGQARVATARQRTWYSGVLPVSLGDTASRAVSGIGVACSSAAIRAELGSLSVTQSAADEIGQAVSAGATVWITGTGIDEQQQIAQAVGRSLSGEVELPYAIYAAGAVVRVFDPAYHRPAREPASGGRPQEVLRRRAEVSQWATIARPIVTLAGGILASDVQPAYDDEARFYVAPKPFAASGGLLAVLDSRNDPQALIDLAKHWLVPGCYGTGIMLLRSGERIEVPWHAATLLFAECDPALASSAMYRVDIAPLEAGMVEPYVASRLNPELFNESAAIALARLLEQCGLANRSAAALAARYLNERAAYEGEAFGFRPSVLERAIDFASRGSVDAGEQRQAA